MISTRDRVTTHQSKRPAPKTNDAQVFAHIPWSPFCVRTVWHWNASPSVEPLNRDVEEYKGTNTCACLWRNLQSRASYTEESYQETVRTPTRFDGASLKRRVWCCPGEQIWIAVAAIQSGCVYSKIPTRRVRTTHGIVRLKCEAWRRIPRQQLLDVDESAMNHVLCTRHG